MTTKSPRNGGSRKGSGPQKKIDQKHDDGPAPGTAAYRARAREAARANPDESKKIFGEKLAALMRMNGMSQSDVARAAGIPRDSVSTYVRGLTWPSPKYLRKLAGAFNLLPSDLIPGASEMDAAVGLPAMGRPVPATGFSMTETGNGDEVRLTMDKVMPMARALKIIGILTAE